MRRSIIFKLEGHYSGMPNLSFLPDGRLVAAARVQTHASHEPVGDWVAFESRDDGATWTQTDDPTVRYNWPGNQPREKMERMELVQPDGTYLCAGSVGSEYWPEERRGEAEALGLKIREHPPGAGMISVGGYKLFTARSTDQGKTWTRREWVVPGMAQVSGNRPPTFMEDGTILYHVYTTDTRGDHYNYVWRSTDGGDTWRLLPMGTHLLSVYVNETAMVETAPGRVLALQRVDGRPSNLLERWSDDGGVTWTDPLETDIWGYPAHLLKLRDGRILCAFGYRREPGGTQRGRRPDVGPGPHGGFEGRRWLPQQPQPQRRPRLGGRPWLSRLRPATRRQHPDGVLHHRVGRHHPHRRNALGGVGVSEHDGASHAAWVPERGQDVHDCHITLSRSHLGPGGARYKPLFTAPVV